MDAPEVPNGLPARSRAPLPWRAVLTQVATIIAGVLIALGAQAWWSYRQDRDKESRYLRQLRAETVTTRARMSAGVAYQDSALQRIERMVQLLRSSGDIPPADSTRRWSSSGTNESWRPVNGALRAMMSTGDIGLVRDDSLRSAISDYAARLDAVAAALNRHESEYFSRYTIMRDRMQPHVILPASRWQDPFVSTSTYEFNVADMRKDLALQSALLSIRVSYSNYRGRYIEIRNAATDLINMMDARKIK